MSDADRWGSQLLGAAMTLYGVRHFRRGGWILAGFGWLLFRRGYSGHCHTYDLFGVSSLRRPELPAKAGSHGPELPAKAGSHSSLFPPTYGDRSTDHVS